MYCTPLAGSSFLDESFIKVEKVDSTNAKIWEKIIFQKFVSVFLDFSFANLDRGQGESAGTLVLAVKTQLLEIVYFWKFDTKFDFISIELAL
jgi:hypothetical protein